MTRGLASIDVKTVPNAGLQGLFVRMHTCILHMQLLYWILYLQASTREQFPVEFTFHHCLLMVELEFKSIELSLISPTRIHAAATLPQK
jgi:hypothetical protein